MICPECGFEAKNLRGWKMHMSKSHDGYTDAQLAEVAESASSEQGAAAAGYPDFESAAAAIASGVANPTDTPTDRPKRKPRATSAQKQASLEVQQRFDAMRGKFSEVLAKICNVILTQSMELDPMTPDESKAMKEALEFPLQILNVQIDVEPLNVSLTSFWVTLIVPISMFLTLVIPRAMGITGKEKADVRTTGQEGAQTAVQ